MSDKWFSVDKKLPFIKNDDSSDLVLVKAEDKTEAVCYYRNGKWFSADCSPYEKTVTHWTILSPHERIRWETMKKRF